MLYIMEHVNPGLPEHYQVQWPNIVGKTPWLAAQNHLSHDELCRFYQEPDPDTPSQLELVTEDIYCRSIEDAAQRESGSYSLPPSCAGEAETWDSPGLQPLPPEDKPSSQPHEQEDRPHKFQPGPDWHMVATSKTGPGTEGAQPKGTSSVLDPLDQELRKDNVNDVLGDYLEEQQSAVQALIHANPGLTGSESPEAMDIDTVPPLESVADTRDQAMETESTEPSPRTFQPELEAPICRRPQSRLKTTPCWMLTRMCWASASLRPQEPDDWRDHQNLR